MHKVAAIEKRHYLYAGRQKMIVEVIDLRVQGLEHRVSVRAFPQENDAFDNVLVIDNHSVFPVDRLCHLPEPDFWSLGNEGKIAHHDRCATLRFKNSSPDVFDVPKQADFTDVHLLLPFLDKAAPRINVV